MEDTTSKNQRSSAFELLREKELAHRWKTSRRTLQRWRTEGFGPAYILIGGTIRYRMADILDYEQRNRRGGGTV